jgi:hypothetical protein
MAKRVIDVGGDRALLDIASYARPGPGHRDRLSAADLEHISLTVHRAPEVMIKVLSRGGQDLAALGRHFAYIGRNGELEIETDDGNGVKGRRVGKDLLEDWDLDLYTHRRHSNLAAAYGRRPPKLVHKLMFSMPPGTPPDKLLAAVRNFAREEFALKHRYAMVLHTDEPHPHVHMVVKAVSEQGVRLNIRKATLREWRKEFARHLREQGVAANATERAVRGQTRTPKSDAIFRSAQRGDSTHVRRRIQIVASALLNDAVLLEPGHRTLLRTRSDVVTGWRAVSSILVKNGKRHLAAEIQRFLGQMSPPQTDTAQLAAELRQRAQKARFERGSQTR